MGKTGGMCGVRLRRDPASWPVAGNPPFNFPLPRDCLTLKGGYTARMRVLYSDGVGGLGRAIASLAVTFVAPFDRVRKSEAV